uniref:Endonuclease/exonuclease/phosphatase domain-containing protein n=1 Tax=Paramoeba aestuarina TaxID=180227 RepID=A0A7S4N9Q1_9EUKA|mmetsp:Transcript_12988/g.19984  ORF Transcript_12988/g.19984 Transcript_12988/m.19984 type:complete len:365 (+) Transcript_12988:71-1165(+)
MSSFIELVTPFLRPSVFFTFFFTFIASRLIGINLSFLAFRRINKIQHKQHKQEENKHALPPSLRVLSHNVWAHYLVPAPGRLRRLRGLLKHIEEAQPKYDLVLLQELFLFQLGPFCLSNEVEEFCSKMFELGFIYQSRPTESLRGGILANILPMFPVQNSGLAIFSRYPLQSSTFEKFEDTAELLNNKGILHTQVSFHDHPLVNVITIHMDSRRRSQMSQLSQIQRKLGSIPSNQSVIIAGDFNMSLHPVVSSATSARGSLRSVFDGERATTYNISNTRKLLGYINQLTCGWLFPVVFSSYKNSRGIDHMFVSERVFSPQRGKACIVGFEVPGSNEKVSDHMGLDVIMSTNGQNLDKEKKKEQS